MDRWLQIHISIFHQILQFSKQYLAKYGNMYLHPSVQYGLLIFGGINFFFFLSFNSFKLSFCKLSVFGFVFMGKFSKMVLILFCGVIFLSTKLIWFLFRFLHTVSSCMTNFTQHNTAGWNNISVSFRIKSLFRD